MKWASSPSDTWPVPSRSLEARSIPLPFDFPRSLAFQKAKSKIKEKGRFSIDGGTSDIATLFTHAVREDTDKEV